MGKTIAIILILAGILYLLYINGYLIINAKRAVSFVGSTRGSKATFSSCTGHIKRVVRFNADKICTFTLETELTNGEVTVELLDSAKQKIMCLNSINRSSAIAVKKNKRYYWVFRFKSATGKYVLNWD